MAASYQYGGHLIKWRAEITFIRLFQYPISITFSIWLNKHSKCFNNIMSEENLEPYQTCPGTKIAASYQCGAHFMKWRPEITLIRLFQYPISINCYIWLYNQHSIYFNNIISQEYLEPYQTCPGTKVAASYQCGTLELIKLHWLPIQNRIDFKVIILLFKACHKQVPDYIMDMLQVCAWTETTSIKQFMFTSFVAPRTSHITFADRAFSVYGPKLWNKLPNYIRGHNIFQHIFLDGTPL